jgi:hypothetical protein
MHSLETLYLNQNEIKNNDNLLRIIARTRIIYSKEENKDNIIIILDENSKIQNLDISKNCIYMKNQNQISLFKTLVNDTYLLCLDYSIILDNFERPEIHKGENYKKLKAQVKEMIEDFNNIKTKRTILFSLIDDMNFVINKYEKIFKKYMDNEELKEILSQDFDEKKNLMQKENIEHYITYELLQVLGKTENDLYNDDNYNIIINLIKYILLYKVNRGLINKWLQGINKCLIIV